MNELDQNRKRERIEGVIGTILLALAVVYFGAHLLLAG